MYVLAVVVGSVILFNDMRSSKDLVRSGQKFERSFSLRSFENEDERPLHKAGSIEDEETNGHNSVSGPASLFPILGVNEASIDQVSWAHVDLLSLFKGSYRLEDKPVTKIRTLVYDEKARTYLVYDRHCGSSYNHIDGQPTTIPKEREHEHFEICTNYPLWKWSNSNHKDYLGEKRNPLSALVKKLVDDVQVLNSTKSLEYKKEKVDKDKGVDTDTPDTLIALTTSNELPITLVTIQYLKELLPFSATINFIVIDDCSSDGTVSVLRKRGFEVISKTKPYGLSHSWNVAYEVASRRGYKYLFVMNNDVLVTKETVLEIRDLLYERGNQASVVGGLTTSRGAGHNPIQGIFRSLDSSNKVGREEAFQRYSYDPRNLYDIQNAALSLPQDDGQAQNFVNRKKHKTFNGYLFALNLAMCPKFIYNPDMYMMIDHVNYPMIEQENYLSANIHNAKLPKPLYATRSFAYHFKSITVRKALAQLGNSKSASSASNMIQRDNLDLYRHGSHNETREVNIAEKAQIVPDIYMYPNRKEDRRGLLTIGMAISNTKNGKGVAGDIMTAHELGDALEKLYGGDHGVKHRKIEIIYLPREMWYNIRELAKLDVLITFLDSYDISLAMRQHVHGPYGAYGSSGSDNQESIGHHLKNNLKFVAWARNWFDRWANRPWMGHYDMILVSSHSALRLYNQLNDEIGFPLTCVQNCYAQNAYMRTADIQYVQNGLGRSLKFPEAASTEIHVKVPVHLLLLATNEKTFSPKENEDEPAKSECTNSKDKDSASDADHFDFLLTASYHGSKRAIMSEDLGALPGIGAVVGANWDRVKDQGMFMGVNSTRNHATSWLALNKGFLRYECMPQLYRKSSVVIDDANHATSVWGSVNSRVFNALAVGTSVVTNGFVGSKETFGGLLPFYCTNVLVQGCDSLEHSLKNLKNNANNASAEVLNLQAEVLRKHTYSIRAKEVSKYLSEIGIEFESEAAGAVEVEPTQKISDEFKDRSVETCKICVGIRTMVVDLPKLGMLIRSLLLQQHQFNKNETHDMRVNMQFFIIDTEPSIRLTSSNESNVNLFKKFTNGINDMQKDHTTAFFMRDQWSDESNKYTAVPRPKSKLYGYDTTDTLLSYWKHSGLIPATITYDSRKGRNGQNSQNGQTKHEDVDSPCDWIMFTNGDNMMNSGWLENVSPYFNKSGTEIIAWDFVSHHLRKNKNRIKESNQKIEVNVEKRGFVDLSSFMVKSSRISKAGRNARFLEQSIMTRDIHARDFFFLQNILKGVAEVGSVVHYVREILLFHQ